MKALERNRREVHTSLHTLKAVFETLINAGRLHGVVKCAKRNKVEGEADSKAQLKEEAIVEKVKNWFKERWQEYLARTTKGPLEYYSQSESTAIFLRLRFEVSPSHRIPLHNSIHHSKQTQVARAALEYVVKAFLLPPANDGILQPDLAEEWKNWWDRNDDVRYFFLHKGVELLSTRVKSISNSSLPRLCSHLIPNAITILESLTTMPKSFLIDGFSSTAFLVKGGARVIIASRTESKVQETIDQLVQANPADQGMRERLSFVRLDLNSLKQVEESAEEVLRKEQRLDGIVTNSGIMAWKHELTEDGIEQQFQVNHLGHFLFVTKLLPLLEKTSDLTGHPSRVVNLSSFAHNFISLYPFASLSFNSKADINRTYGSKWIRYSVSKLANIYFAKELNRRVTSGKVKSLSVHPGFVKSQLYDENPVPGFVTKLFIDIDEGAYSSVYAVADEDVEKKNLWGAYLVPFNTPIEPRRGNDVAKQRELWDLSEALISEALSRS
ncbi:uncharacterized protein JCM6883_004540 [Sporobolomyces salmoneus]|uniref:uncharacterized protein n=1 Tax=Sporobolomyces salmoneus TaxID=183962 RepID=UPI00317A8A98